MIKREIKEFKLSFNGGVDFPINTPFTAYSALCETGRIERNSIDAGACTIENMRVQASFAADVNNFSAKFAYLSVSGVESAADMYFNGELLCELDGKKRKHLIDISALLKSGENTVAFEFDNIGWNSGIVGSVEFMKFDNAIIGDVRLSERETEEGVILDISLDTLGDASNARAVATLISGAGQIYYGGFNKGVASITVRDPLYWWPKGLGVQNVYKLAVNLYGEEEVEDTAEFKVGLRTLLPDVGHGGGLLRVNGVPFVPMGAVYVPEKNYLPDESRKRTAAFVTSAAMANFNAFVIKDALSLPSDEFFDLCDVHGIAVICQVNYFDNAVIQNLASISHHPSFAPIDIVGFSADEREAFCAALAEKAPWASVSVFESAPEYFGECSVPSDKTTYAATAEEQRNIFSAEMEKFSGGACRDMASSVSENYLYAYNFSDFAYTTRLSQAENCKRRVLSGRCDFGKSGRAVFSSVGAERLISDSSLDHNVSWKALQYQAAKFFAPVVISADILGSQVSFRGSNAGKTAVFGTLEYRIIDSNNIVIYKNSKDIDIAEHSSAYLLTEDFGEHIEGHECDRYLEFVLCEGAHTLYRDVVLFTKPKYFKYKKPVINAEIEGADRRFCITLSADRYVGGLELSFEGVGAVFSDNYFDITSPMPLKIAVNVNSPVETAKSLKKQFKMRSIYDIGKTE